MNFSDFVDWMLESGSMTREEIRGHLGINPRPQPHDPRCQPVDIVDQIDELVNWQLEQGEADRR
jgi:hypothetical protein